MAVPLRGADDEVGKLQLEVQRREEERSGVGAKGGLRVLGKRRSATAENGEAGLIHIQIS